MTAAEASAEEEREPTAEEMLEAGRLLARDLAGYNPGHGDFLTAGRWMCAVLGIEPPN